MVDRLVRRDVAGAARTAAAGGLTVVAVNLPFVLLGRQGWPATYDFQSARQADSSSGVFRWFDALLSGTDPTMPERVLVVGVWSKSALLFPLLLHAASALRPQPTH